MRKELTNYINAGFGCMSIQTAEYHRCIGDIRATVNGMAGSIGSWDARGNVTNMLTGEMMARDLYSPDSFFEWIRSVIGQMEKGDSEFPSVWIVNDLHLFMKNPDPAMLASFRDCIREGAAWNHHVLLVGAVTQLCPEIEKLVTPIEFELPTKDEIEEIITRVTSGIKSLENFPKDSLDRVVNAAAGMTSTEIEDAVSLSWVAKKTLDWELIMKEKSKAVEKSGCLTYHETKLHKDDIGGLTNLIEYIDLRKNSFTEAAKEFGLPAPKGILILGPAGTGKSLCAKVTADVLKRPLISMDVGAVYGSLVGQSESNMRLALKTVEACAPCVLMLDEVEKSMSGSKSSGQTDGGTGSRVLGTMLTWLNDNESEVYIVATSNDVSALPPELLRKGRFDEIWFADLPSAVEREVIFKIHLRKRKRDVKNFDIKKLVDVTEGYTGAEIEQVVIDGMFEAFGKGDELSTEVMIRVAGETKPLSVINSAKVKELREWSKDRCRPASVQVVAKARNTTKKASVRKLKEVE